MEPLVVKTTGKTRFYKVHENSERDLKYYRKKFWCIDYEKMIAEDKLPRNIEVQGDYNSDKARHLKIMFEKCDNNTFEGTCKTEEEISQWLVRKFIVILEN